MDRMLVRFGAGLVAILTALLCLVSPSPTSAQASTPPAMTSHDSVRAFVQAALYGIQNADLGATGGGFLDLRAMKAARPAGAHAAAAPCQYGQRAGTAILNADRSQSRIIEGYHDLACTRIAASEVLTVDAASTADRLAGNAVITAYDRASKVAGFAALRIEQVVDASGRTLTARGTQAQAAGGTPYANYGFTCTTNRALSSATCTSAIVNTSSSKGRQAGAVVTDKTQLTDKYHALVTIAGITYCAPYGLSLKQLTSTAAWEVTGAPQTDTIEGTMDVDAEKGNAAIRFASPTSGLVIAGASKMQRIGLKATHGATALGAIDVDVNGSGSVTYANGDSAKIVNWTISG